MTAKLKKSGDGDGPICGDEWVKRPALVGDDGWLNKVGLMGSKIALPVLAVFAGDLFFVFLTNYCHGEKLKIYITYM